MLLYTRTEPDFYIAILIFWFNLLQFLQIISIPFMEEEEKAYINK